MTVVDGFRVYKEVDSAETERDTAEGNRRGLLRGGLIVCSCSLLSAPVRGGLLRKSVPFVLQLQICTLTMYMCFRCVCLGLFLFCFFTIL